VQVAKESQPLSQKSVQKWQKMSAYWFFRAIFYRRYHSQTGNGLALFVGGLRGRGGGRSMGADCTISVKGQIFSRFLAILWPNLSRTKF
jgi:hypothetical protein